MKIFLSLIISALFLLIGFFSTWLAYENMPSLQTAVLLTAFAVLPTGLWLINRHISSYFSPKNSIQIQRKPDGSISRFGSPNIHGFLFNIDFETRTISIKLPDAWIRTEQDGAQSESNGDFQWSGSFIGNDISLIFDEEIKTTSEKYIPNTTTGTIYTSSGLQFIRLNSPGGTYLPSEKYGTGHQGVRVSIESLSPNIDRSNKFKVISKITAGSRRNKFSDLFYAYEFNQLWKEARTQMESAKKSHKDSLIKIAQEKAKNQADDIVIQNNMEADFNHAHYERDDDGNISLLIVVNGHGKGLFWTPSESWCGSLKGTSILSPYPESSKYKLIIKIHDVEYKKKHLEDRLIVLNTNFKATPDARDFHQKIKASINIANT